ncbi:MULTISPECIES: hypothetical protein [unclassified Flavobacterium]|jgi:hypothetical protein|uniref:hypothetical protein n=1 Tax=unclassified Flavobacterium TaxID=196869 RepID=UPI0025C2C097|nr:MULTISPECIES: hypothetical protein [unclassified Flavobacterium]
MKPSDKTMIHFYQQLGKVFYSVATVDKTVREEEITRLKEIVKKEWLPLENTFNEFGDDSAYQIEIVFDWLVENDWNIGDVISDFEFFKKEHPSLFTESVNTLILKTAKVIADSFSGKNKSELVLINELSGILSKQ